MSALRSSTTREARILGVGAHRPPRLIDNAEVCTWIDSSDEWIQQRTGIRTRRWAAPDVDVVDMAEDASAKALAAAGLTGSDVDAVILATVSWPFQTPAAAAVLAHRLGATPAAAFDVSAGCAGFCHGIAVAVHDSLTGRRTTCGSGERSRVLVIKHCPKPAAATETSGGVGAWGPPTGASATR